MRFLAMMWMGVAVLASPAAAQQFLKPGSPAVPNSTNTQSVRIVTQPAGKFGALQNVIVTETKPNGTVTRRSCQILNLPGGQQSVTCP